MKNIDLPYKVYFSSRVQGKDGKDCTRLAMFGNSTTSIPKRPTLPTMKYRKITVNVYENIFNQDLWTLEKFFYSSIPFSKLVYIESFESNGNRKVYWEKWMIANNNLVNPIQYSKALLLFPLLFYTPFDGRFSCFSSFEICYLFKNSTVHTDAKYNFYQLQ